MPLDPHAKRLLDMLAVSAPAVRPQFDRHERRRTFASLMELGGRPESVGGVEELVVPGPGGPLPLRKYSPTQPLVGPAPALVYVHGGGLVAGSVDTHDTLCRTLANAAGCLVVSVGYRLAPESPFPAAVDDAVAAMSWTLTHASALRLAPHRIGIAGDSAGATVAAAVCHILKDTPGPRPALQLLLCPILDVGGDTASRRCFGAGYLLDMQDFALESAQYLPAAADASDPRASPLRASNLSGLPATYIHTAEYDPMRDEGVAYADRLKDAGIEVHYTCHAGMIHLFYALNGVIPYASTAMRQIGAQTARALC
jgi:acetyl esterase/lipase